MRSARWIAAAAAAISLLALGPVASAPAQGGLAVARPKLDQLVTGAQATVILQTPSELRSLAVRLNGKGARGSFHEQRPGVWKAVLPRRSLRVGRNHVAVTAVSPSGRREVVSSRFVLGERRRGYLTLNAPKRVGSSAVARLTMRSLPNLRFSAKLNGRGIANRFRRSFLPSRTAYLGSDDGLHFGRNVVEVLAARGNGSFDVERRVIQVSRGRPLVGAGPDRYTVGTRPVLLAGRSAPAPLAGAGAAAAAAKAPHYRWQVIRRPPGSRAQPQNPGSARTRFRPDTVGIYRLRLTASEGGSLRGSDVVTVTDAEATPPIGVPVETMAGEGGPESWIEVGNERFPLGYQGPERNVIQAVFLDRGTLEVLGSAGYPGTAAAARQLEAEIERYGARALTIVSNPAPSSEARGPRQVSSAFGQAIAKLGVKSVPSLTDAGWSVVGVYGSGDGGSAAAGTNPAPVPGNLRGHLALDSSNLFTFVPAGVAGFDTSVPGAAAMRNRIEVGGRTYDSEALCAGAEGGFQLLVLAAETLQPVQSASFSTNGCPAAEEAAETEALIAELAAVPSNGQGAQLVFLQSIGTPYPSGEPAVAALWPALTERLQALGATGAVAGAARSGYALVGASGVPDFPLAESSQSLTGWPARIAGVMQPGPLGAYVPAATSPSGSAPFDLAEIAQQPSQPWPFSETPGQKAALAYVAELLDLPPPTPESSCYVPPQPDVRSEYCNEDLRGSWTAFVSQLRAAQCGPQCQSEHGFSAEDWEAVRAELAGRGQAGEFFEFNAVQSTWETVRSLQSPFGAAGLDAVVDLNSLAAEIEQALQPPQQSDAEGNYLSIFDHILFEVSYASFEGGLGGPLFGALASSFGIEALYANGPEGSPLLGEFRVSAADLAVDLASNFQSASDALGTVGELVVSDYGKLRAVAEDPNLAGFTPRTVQAATAGLEAGSRKWIYQSLFPAAYEALDLKPGRVNGSVPGTAHEYECQWTEIAGNIPIEGYYRPFSPESNAEYRYSPPATLGVLVKRGTTLDGDGGKEVKPASPPNKLFGPLYKPPSENGLGVFVPWFWRQAFGFPDVRSISC